MDRPRLTCFCPSLQMVRFGADQILSGRGGTFTDEDIDVLIARGEERTAETQANLREDAKHSLANFSLLADDEGPDTFSFHGKNYREETKTTGNFINLPQRQRKRNYDLNAASRETAGLKAHAADAAAKKKRKGPTLHDFQLFDMAKLDVIRKKELNFVTQTERQIKKIGDLRKQALDAPTIGSGVAAGRSREEILKSAEELESQLDSFKLSDEDVKEKKALEDDGFPDWSRKDYKAFCAALERRGRYDFEGICRDITAETNKDRGEIKRYFVSFWQHYSRINDWEKVLDRIDRGEKKILRLRQIRDAIQEKVERHLEDTFGPHYSDNSGSQEIPSVAELIFYSWPKMKINYGLFGKPKGYQEEEDSFLVAMMYRHGYGAAERIRMEIRRAWQFRFDWYFKSRSAQEIQKRCDAIVKIIERENEDVRKKESEQGLQKQQGQSQSLATGLSSTVAVGNLAAS